MLEKNWKKAESQGKKAPLTEEEKEQKKAELQVSIQEGLDKLNDRNAQYKEFAALSPEGKRKAALADLFPAKRDGDAITKQEFKNFLASSNHGRDKLFTISLALGMNGAQFQTMCSAAGEVPCYNFHSPAEIILYICHHAENASYRTLDGAMSLLDRYKILLAAAEVKESEEAASAEEMSRVFWNDLESYLHDMQDLPENEAIDTILKYLVDNSDYIVSCSSSQSARAVFEELYQDVTKRLKPAIVSSDDRDDAQPSGQGKVWQDVVGAVTKEWFSQADDEELEDFSIALEDVTRTEAEIKGIQEHRLNTARIHDIRSGAAPVQKSDLVFLSLLKNLEVTEARRIDQLDLGASYERLKKFREFRRATDHMLDGLGMPRLYTLNFFDNAVLSCFASSRPGDYFLNYFFDR